MAWPGRQRGRLRLVIILDTNVLSALMRTSPDAAVVSWEAGKKKPKTRQLHNTTGEGALSGAFWGMFLGLIFLVPLLGAAVGAALGAWSTSIVDMGISDKIHR